MQQPGDEDHVGALHGESPTQHRAGAMTPDQAADRQRERRRRHECATVTADASRTPPAVYA